MNFLEALRQCEHSKERIRSPLVSSKEMKKRTRIYRKEWESIKYPGKFIWVTAQNIPFLNIGGEKSMPLLMEMPDFLADDWEVERFEEKK